MLEAMGFLGALIVAAVLICLVGWLLHFNDDGYDSLRATVIGGFLLACVGVFFYRLFT